VQRSRGVVGKAIHVLVYMQWGCDGGCRLACIRGGGVRPHGPFTWQAMILMRDALMPPDP